MLFRSALRIYYLFTGIYFIYWKNAEGKPKEIIDEWSIRGYGRKRDKRIGLSVTRQNGLESKECQRERPIT